MGHDVTYVGDFITNPVDREVIEDFLRCFREEYQKNEFMMPDITIVLYYDNPLICQLRIHPETQSEKYYPEQVIQDIEKWLQIMFRYGIKLYGSVEYLHNNKEGSGLLIITEDSIQNIEFKNISLYS